MMRNALRMSSMTRPLDYGIESAVLVDSVLDSSYGAVGFMESVFPLGYVTISTFFLGMNITGMVIFNAISKFILCRSLMSKTYIL